MPASIIATLDITKPEAYQEYAKLAGPATLKHCGRFLVRGGKKTALEGDLPFQRIVVTEVPDVEAAKRFYNSAKYQAAKRPWGGGFPHDRGRRVQLEERRR